MVYNLSYANLSNFSGIQSSVGGCNFTGANLDNLIIGEGGLSACNLTDANLTNACLEYRERCILCNTILEDGSISNDGC
ncbi:MAG: pentapeptide repeat-containing protein, partial [Xenococcaceae cyanobacterium]